MNKNFEIEGQKINCNFNYGRINIELNGKLMFNGTPFNDVEQITDVEITEKGIELVCLVPVITKLKELTEKKLTKVKRVLPQELLETDSEGQLDEDLIPNLEEDLAPDLEDENLEDNLTPNLEETLDEELTPNLEEILDEE